MGPQHLLRRSLASLFLSIAIFLVWSADALANAVVRFVHGVPGVGKATITIDDGTSSFQLGPFGFGQATAWHSIRSGSFRWTLASGGKTLASGTTKVGADGAYDIVVLLVNMKVWLGVYPAKAGEQGTSLVRVIHGAPELGSPALTVDGKQVLAHLGFTQATPYLTLAPGKHSLAAVRPGTNSPLVSVAGATFEPGVSYSAVVLGTRGQMTRVVTLTDRGGPAIEPAAATAPAKSAAKPKTSENAADEENEEYADKFGGAIHNGVIHVQTGDCLWWVAMHLVGYRSSPAKIEHEVVELWDANARRIGSGDPNKIYPGQTLVIPKA